MILVLLLLLAQQVRLQGPPQVTPLNSVPPNPWCEWNQDAETVQEAQSFIYRYHLDGAQTGAAFSGVECGGTVKPWLCRAPLPVTIGGEHTLYITTVRVTPEGEFASPPSATTTFTIELLGAPTSPQSIIIIK